MTITTIIILAFCGVLTNVMSALFGIGGGVLMVPILHTLFPEFSMQMVAATSLTTVMGTAMINLVYFYRQHIAIRAKLLIWCSVGMLIGVQLGFEGSFLVPNEFIVWIFVITLIALSLVVLTSKPKVQATTVASNVEYLKGLFLCAFGGSVAGMTGIGGGSIMSPLLALLPSVKMYQIAVYSNVMMIFGGVGSLYSYLNKTPPMYLENSWQIGYVNFSVVLIVIAFSFVTSFFSMKMRGGCQPKAMQYWLVGILLSISVYMLILQYVI
ncbi:sulfite exporter TauE/SafE family protein [[Pasteurella] aerogenes]|nr:sulfite exporter TauE/SafE family protein [[Pasteurella] aerogenes]